MKKSLNRDSDSYRSKELAKSAIKEGVLSVPDGKKALTATPIAIGAKNTQSAL